MKKIIVTLLAALALTGCGDDPTTTTTEEDAVRDVAHLMNSTETEMVNFWLKDFERSTYLYRDLWYGIATRNRYGGASVKRLDSELPFCDVIAQLVKSEARIRTSVRGTLTNQWRRAYGITLAEQCGYVAPAESKSEAEVEQIEIDGDAPIAPAEYDVLIESARECKRAKHALLNLTKIGDPITKSQRTEINNLVIDCKMQLLEDELNK